MFKLLKDWKFIFLFTLLIFYLVYLGIVFKDELELPSNEWSRNLLITELKAKNISDLMSNENIFTIPISNENSFIVFWHEDNDVKYSLISSDGTTLLIDKLNLNVDSIKKIRGFLFNDIITLYILENKELNKYDFNLKTKGITSVNSVAQSVKDFIVYDDLLIYFNDNTLTLSDRKGHLENIENINVDRLEAVEDKNFPLYHIAIYEKTTTGQNFLSYITYDLNNKKIYKYNLTSIANSVKQSLERVDIAVIDNKINILASVVDNRFGSNTLYRFQFNKNNASNFSKEVINLNATNPYPKIIKKDIQDELTFIASVNITKGRDTETINIVKYTIDKNNNIKSEKLLTKTNDTSLNHYYFNINNNDYLVWTDISGKDKRILLSSSNTNIIKASKQLRLNEIFDIFMATFTGLIPSLFLSLIPIMNIFVPTILFIFLISIINLRWIENYSNKTLIVIFTLHSVLKIIYSNKSILSNYDIHNFLPIFLKNTLIFYSIIALTSLISLYCAKRFIETSRQRNHLVKTYSFFAFIDIMLYTFLTIPYIYSYLLFTYKINIY